MICRSITRTCKSLLAKPVGFIAGISWGPLIVSAITIFTGLHRGEVVDAAVIQAGCAKIDITNRDAGPVNDPLFVKALVIKCDSTTLALITLDVVAVGEIGHIKNDYLPKVRKRLQSELDISPESVVVNASHCHGVPVANVDEKTVEAVTLAVKGMVPVRIGAGVGHENRIMENRRLKLKNGRTVDVRHAYSMPHDDEVAEIGPVDTEIGVVRLDRLDGKPLAAIYNFACHPIQGVPGMKNTADLSGFASQVIEDNLGDGVVALFIQGCGGDINPVGYKGVDSPRHAEPLGNMLGLSTLKSLNSIKTSVEVPIKLLHETISLPRVDNAERIARLEGEQTKLVGSFRGTSLNFKTFLPLAIKYNSVAQYPSYYSHGYLHEQAIGRDDLSRMDEENRRNIEQYLANIRTMEELTRLQTNLALLRKHHANNMASGKRTIDVELVGIRLGDFAMVTSPGELTVQIGLNIKRSSPHELTFVAGYTNGYIYYAPTKEQLLNEGAAQEDSDCLLAPDWQGIFEDAASKMLKRL